MLLSFTISGKVYKYNIISIIDCWKVKIKSLPIGENIRKLNDCQILNLKLFVKNMYVIIHTTLFF